MSMSPPYAAPFSTAVHGTVFAARAAVVQRLHAGDRLILVPDPPGDDDETPPCGCTREGGDVWAISRCRWPRRSGRGCSPAALRRVSWRAWAPTTWRAGAARRARGVPGLSRRRRSARRSDVRSAGPASSAALR
jgi:hypothetical protein